MRGRVVDLWVVIVMQVIMIPFIFYYWAMGRYFSSLFAIAGLLLLEIFRRRTLAEIGGPLRGRDRRN